MSGRRAKSSRTPSPALVIACLALSIALGGTSYAAFALPKNSVGAIQIKTGAVSSPKVRDASLGVVDLAPAARLALKGNMGPAGPKGDKGDPGSPGFVGFEIVGASSAFDSAPEKTVTISCPAGKRIIGGGAGAWGRAMIWTAPGVALTASDQYDDTTWLAAAREVTPTEESWFLRVNAMCAAIH